MKRLLPAAFFICCLGVGTSYYVAAHHGPPGKIKHVALSDKSMSGQSPLVKSNTDENVHPEFSNAKSMNQYFLDVEEISDEAEKKYIGEMRAWLAALPEEKAKLVRPILMEAHPVLHDLREEIYNKRLELIEISYKKGTDPETLPRLGQQLQKLRKKLRGKLNEVNDRIRREASVEMGMLNAEGFWLQPITKK